MGALTELVDKAISQDAYRIADAIYNNEIDFFELGAENVTEEEIIDYLEQYPDPFWNRNADLIAAQAYRKLCQLLGLIDPPKYFFLAEWHFRKKKNVSEKIIKICIKYDLGWAWRFSTDNDFFMFRPEKHGIGLEIINTPNYTPDRLNEIFWGVETDSGPIRFGW